MRSVAVVEDRVYTGSYMDFGFWEKDNYGVLHYTSLAAQLGIPLIDDEEFWNIMSVDDLILFQSLDRIYIYNVDHYSVETIDSNSKISKIYKVGNSVYFQRINDGIYRIENGKDVLVTDDKIVKEQIVVNIFTKEDHLLIQTRDDGFYDFNGTALKKWNHSSNELLSTVSVYNSIRIRNQGYLLGTISHGLIYLNSDGDFQFQIDKKHGLLNNTVLSLLEDIDNTIWLGLDNGVSYINLDSPYKVYKDFEGRIGSVYASAIYNGNLYLGSNQGLFYRNLQSNDDFTLVKGTQGQVWCLKEFDQTLFCGHDSGTYTINGNTAKKISKYHGTWDIKPLKDNKLLLQGNYDGLYILEKKNNSWQVRNKIKNFNNSSRYFAEMPENKIFINHEYKGVFKVKVDTSYIEAVDVSIDSSIKGANSAMIKYNNELLYSYKEGVFKYDNSEGKFKKDSILSKLYPANDAFISGTLVHDKMTNTLWGFSSSNISFAALGGLSSIPKIKSISIRSDLRDNLIGYENILHLRDNVYLLGNYSGYSTLDIDKLNIKKFNVNISNISNVKRTGNNKTQILDKNLEGNFKSNENTLEISFYVPEYNAYLEVNYQYRLNGIYDEWNEWSQNSTELFENLPYGNYIFKVRAKLGDRISDNTASYSFKIAKPWYISNLSITLYALGFLLFLLFMHNEYKRYYSKQRQKIIETNNREQELTKVKNEQNIIKIKNEKLQLDFKTKSKELATSTMSLIRKNELLTTIKDKLNGLQDKSPLSPLLNIIEKSLKQNDDWEFFQEAFNNADSEFLKNLKALHPNLSPNDLKLCAYLRLNLSSKEIAPLLNISTRSVEIKRYRLRKKMDLSHDENLVTYIIEL
ncbi:MAG: LuxR C-terminal-related transcriptional regulator [Maribacter sp.]|nr:LuxR C-terminal-related transcriptional regulator [Maribacter sp.]